MLLLAAVLGYMFLGGVYGALVALGATFMVLLVLDCTGD